VITTASLLHLVSLCLVGWMVNKLDSEKWLTYYASDKERGRGKETVTNMRKPHT